MTSPAHRQIAKAKPLKRAATFYQSDEEDGKAAVKSMVVRPIFWLNDYKAY